MTKMNLLLAAGNAIVNDNSIDFLGGTSEQIDPQTGTSVTTLPADVRSNGIINDGELNCDFVIKGVDSFFTINLWSATDNLIVSVNEWPSLCSVKKFSNSQFALLNSAGSHVATKIDKKSALTITNSLSSISVSIDGVRLITQYFPNNGVNISFSLFGQTGVKLSDIRISSKAPKVFVVMQFLQEFNELYEEVIKPTCESMGLEVIRADESFNNGSIIHEIITELTDAALIVADITPDNPNVFYEVGYAHAIKKDVILLCNEKRERLPFDLADSRTIFYKNTIAGHSQVKERLKKHIESIVKVQNTSNN